MTITDETWAAARSTDRDLTGRERRNVAGLVVLAVVVLFVLSMGPISGLTSPRVDTHLIDIAVDRQAHQYTISMIVGNDGWFDEHIDGIGMVSPGQRVVGYTPEHLVVPVGGRRRVAVVVRVASCGVVQADESTLNFKYARPWGSLSHDESLPTFALEGPANDVCQR